MLFLRYILFIFIMICGFINRAAEATPILSGQNLFSDQKLEVEAGKKGNVVVFMSAKCPCSNSHANIVKKLAEDFKDFNFVVVHSNADETVDVAKEYFKTLGFAFPVIQDGDGKLADQFKALKTPHAFLLDNKGKILYKGGVTSSTNGETADSNFLKEALLDANEGKAIRKAEGRTLGCTIERGKKHVW